MHQLPPTAHAQHCQCPSATGKPGRIFGTPKRQTHTAQSGASGHGGAAHPRSHHSSLTESVVEPEPTSESVDDPHDVVSRSSASPSSNAAAALAAARMGAQLSPHRKALRLDIEIRY